jgi:protein TonB
MVCSFAAASGSHALLFFLLVLAVRSSSRSGLVGVVRPAEIPKGLVWLRGVGGGGGGSGNGQQAPAQHLRRQGSDRASMPGPPPALTMSTAVREPDPIDRVTVPVRPIGDALASMPGIVDAGTFVSTSLGPGRGPNAGSGDGPGIGDGRGDGLDLGENGGFGGRTYGPGSGVTMPVALHMERPRYSTDAMRARVQGVVVIECVVRPNGRCSDIRVARSLDPHLGLDEEARRAAALWRFTPGTLRGQVVPVVVRLELEFTIR